MRDLSFSSGLTVLSISLYANLYFCFGIRNWCSKQKVVNSFLLPFVNDPVVIWFFFFFFHIPYKFLFYSDCCGILLPRNYNLN